MNDPPEKTNKKFPHISIGALYSRDEQCYLATARKGKEFEANKTCGDPSECKNLYCEYFGKSEGCKTLNHLVADGTSCGEDKVRKVYVHIWLKRGFSGAGIRRAFPKGNGLMLWTGVGLNGAVGANVQDLVVGVRRFA